MMKYIIMFIAGLIIGAIIGITVMCVIYVSKEEER